MQNYIKSNHWEKEEKDFKTWYESSFQYIPPEVIEQFNVIKEKFTSYKNGIKIAHQYHSKFPVGEVNINKRKIKVVAGYDVYRAHYDSNTEKIFIPYNENPEVMEDDFLHELGHAIDTKYQSPTWVGVSKKHQNNPAVTDIEKTAYVKEPVEFDAMGSHITYVIEKDFNENGEIVRKRIIKGLTEWLKNGGDFPYVTTDVINKWQTKPTLWKKFQTRIWNLVQKLQQIK